MTGGGNDNGGKKNGDASGTKTSSSYFLSSNDNPRNLITHVQLKGENYEEWSRAIRTALRAKKKLIFIDGTMKKPDDESPNLEDWWTVNSMLVACVGILDLMRQSTKKQQTYKLIIGSIDVNDARYVLVLPMAVNTASLLLLMIISAAYGKLIVNMFNHLHAPLEGKMKVAYLQKIPI
ncbi:chitinase 5-like protein [Tanacetum coccineum]